MGRFEGLVSRFREFWSRNCGNLLLSDDQLALLYNSIDVKTRIDALAPLSKIRVLWRAKNNELIAEISGNLLKPHKEVILINLANFLISLSLGLNADHLSNHAIKVHLLHAMILCCPLVVERSAIQLLEAEQVGLNSLNLWFYNVYGRFFSFHQFFGCGFKSDLCVLKSGVIALLGSLKMSFDEIRSVLIFNWAFDDFQKWNSDFCRKVLTHVLIAFISFFN
jgi:hypothetical protein